MRRSTASCAFCAARKEGPRWRSSRPGLRPRRWRSPSACSPDSTGPVHSRSSWAKRRRSRVSQISRSAPSARPTRRARRISAIRGTTRGRAVPACRRRAAHRQRRGGGRHLHEPRWTHAALLPGQAGAGDGAAGGVGTQSAGRRARLGGSAAMTFFIVSSAIKVFVVFNLIMVGVALLTLLERRVCAWMQDRLGPNRVGPQGILQPAADGLKNFLKEETSPAMADKALFTLAPIVSFVPALLTFGVIPFAAPLPTPWGLVPMVVADLPVGFLYILAISSLGVYGIVLAGWSSNNKYALLGGLRASAQMISYEIALGMSTVAVLLLAGNVTLSQVIAQQQQGLWFVIPLTLAFIIFFISALAETNRLPFDLPEAEGESNGR